MPTPAAQTEAAVGHASRARTNDGACVEPSPMRLGHSCGKSTSAIMRRIWKSHSLCAL